MYNILLIDDEPGIVNGLAETLNRENMDLQVYTASTTGEGIKVAKQIKLDILCSDIEMPILNGFQFAEKVLKYWKDCKIVFLTGYNEFDYIYKSVHEFDGQYVLKSDEEKLLEVIKKYLLQIEEEQRNRLISEKMQQLMNEYQNSRKEKLWTEYLRNEDDKDVLSILTPICKEEGIDCELPVQCAVGRLLKREDKCNNFAQDLTQYFLKVKEEYKYFYSIYSVFLLNNDSYLILAQKKEGGECPEFRNILKSIQDTMYALDDQKISFIYSEKEMQLTEIKEQIELFHTFLEVNWSENNPVFIKLEDLMKENKGNNNYNCKEKYEISLERLLMEQKFKEIRQAFEELYKNVKSNHERSLSDAQEYYKSVGVIASYIENYVKYIEIPEDLRKSYFHLKYMTSVGEIHKFVMRFLKYMEHNCNLTITEDELIVHKIEAYVMNHITEDLSLDILAELVYFNPSYLSRFYKMNTGKNISQFIAEAKVIKAKELLKNSNEKIEDISEMLGFKSSGYFTVFLKKHIGMTPTEYRNQVGSKK